LHLDSSKMQHADTVQKEEQADCNAQLLLQELEDEK